MGKRVTLDPFAFFLDPAIFLHPPLPFGLVERAKAGIGAALPGGRGRRPRGRGHGDGGKAREKGGGEKEGFRHGRLAGLIDRGRNDRGGRADSATRHLPHRMDLTGFEIGRASWRARVVKYGKVAGGGGRITKKKK